VQIAHLENHGKHLEMHNQIFKAHYQKMDAMHQDISDIKQLLDPQFEPHGITPPSRAQSVISVPTVPPSTVLVAPEMYIQGQKSLADVQDLLEEVNTEIDDSVETDEKKEILRNVRAELEAVEERILVSMQRNKAKGAQIALAENVRQHHEERKFRRRSRQDSGYASISSMEIYQNPPSQISRRPTDSSVDSNGSAVSHQSPPQPQVSRCPTDSGESNWDAVTSAISQPIAGPSFSYYTIVKICEAEM
jgi:hypothetical protein